MPKLEIKDLQRISDEVRRMTHLRDGAGRAKIIVHMGTCGIAAGARQVLQAILDELGRRSINDVLLTNSGCAGLCSREPMITVEVKGESPVKYVNLTPEKAARIVAEHVVGGKAVEEYALAMGSEKLA